MLLGHGSTKNPGSALSVRHHAKVLRERGLFSHVAGAFWKQEPRVHRVLKALSDSPSIYIVPWFATAGYFATEVIPPALGFNGGDVRAGYGARRVGTQLRFYTQPVGTHPILTDLLLEKAREVVDRHPIPVRPKPSSTALILVGHGTPRSSRARREVEARAETLRSTGGYAEVHEAYLEEPPFVADCLSLTRLPHVVVVSMFLSSGLHAAEDVPVLLGEPRSRVVRLIGEGQFPWRNPTPRADKLVWYAPSIGLSPLLTEIVLARAREVEAIEESG